jgi:hypothetical protein
VRSLVEWWVYIIALVAIIAAAVGGAVLGRWLYQRQVRRSLVRLLGRRESVLAAVDGLGRVIEHLLGDEEDAMGRFAADAASEDRRAVADVASRMRIAADDLHSMALPKRLWPIAEEMERAARAVAAQAGRVGEAATPDEALDALAAIKLGDVRADIAAANEHLQPLLDAFRVSDPAVYGGGLYI